MEEEEKEGMTWAQWATITSPSSTSSTYVGEVEEGDVTVIPTTIFGVKQQFKKTLLLYRSL
jgi:hypothetical protein